MDTYTHTSIIHTLHPSYEHPSARPPQVCAVYLAGGLAHGVLSLLLAVGALRWLSLGPQPATGRQASKGEPAKAEKDKWGQH